MYIQAVVIRNSQVLMERNFYKRKGVTRESVILKLESYVIQERLNHSGECWIAAKEFEGPMPKQPEALLLAEMYEAARRAQDETRRADAAAFNRGPLPGRQAAGDGPLCNCPGCQMLDAVRRAQG
jgi:hypothetical protein